MVLLLINMYAVNTAVLQATNDEILQLTANNCNPHG